MDRFYRFFVNRPLLVNVIMAAVVIGGLLAIRTMKFDTAPKFDLGIVNITTFRPGASPEDIELSVTVPIEEEVLNVDGVYKLTSKSMEGMSMVVVRLDPNLSTYDDAVADIQKALDRASSKLPSDLPDKPLVEELSSDKVPVMEIHLSGEVPEAVLRSAARKLQQGLREVDGIAGIDRKGYRTRELKIYLKPEKLHHLGLSYSEIISAINRRNVRDSGGALESFGAEKKVLTVGQFDSPEEVEDVIIRTNGPGNFVRVRDVATVILDYADWQVENRCDGVTGIAVIPRKKAAADALRVASAINAYIEEARATLPPGVNVVTVNEISRFTRDMLGILGANALMGFVLVLAVLLVFFQFRLAFWVALGLPVAMFITALLMPIFGLNVDMISLYTIILMLGMLVDDAIVTGESIFSHREQGISWKEAAAKGAAAIAMPVIVSTLSTIIVFLPLAFLGGLEGKFLFGFPVMVALILFGSLFECQTLLPAHLSHGRPIAPKPKKWFAAIQKRYDVFIEKAVRRRYLTIGLFVLVSVAIVVVMSQLVRFNLYPENNIDTFWVKVELPEGSSFDETRAKVAELERYFEKKVPKRDLLNITAQVGHHDTDMYGGTEGRNPAWALLTVFMQPQGVRQCDTKILVAEAREDVKKMKGFKEIVIRPMDDSPVAGQPIEVEVIGNSADRFAVADEMAAYLKEHEGIVDVWTSYKPGKEIVKLALRHELLASRGLTVADITRAVRIAFDGVVINELQGIDETIDFRLQFQPKDQGKLETLKELMVMNAKGLSVPLRSLADFEMHPGEAAIKHYFGDQVVTVYATIDKEKTDTAQANAELKGFIAESKLLSRFTDVRLFFGGELEQQKEAMGNMGIAFILAMLGLFFLFVLLFNSFTQPLLIMSVIPFGFTGVLIGFGLQGMDLSMIALFGIVGLAGVLVNDSTVMVHGLNRLKRENDRLFLSAKEVADGASSRLRPILITSITTVAGLAPAAYEIGGSNPMMTPMIMAMLWGVLFGTVVSLIFLPCLYASEQDVRKCLRRMLRRENNEAA